MFTKLNLKNALANMIKSFAKIVVIISLPITLILFSPIYILRILVSYLSVFRSDLSDLVSTRSTLTAVDDIYSNPNGNILHMSTFRGNMSLDALRKRFVDKVLKIRSRNGKLRYMELKQYPHQWMGFMFWKWEESFDVTDHINYYEVSDDDGLKVSQQKLREIELFYLTKPWPKGKSPWEIIVIRNVDYDSGEVHSTMILRFHHCIADGLAIMKCVVMNLADGSPKLEDFVRQPRKTVRQIGLLQFFSFIKTTILLPYYFAEHIVESLDLNDWSMVNIKDTNSYCTSLSAKLPLTLLKEIAKKYHVGLTSVVYSGFTVALREAMIKKIGNVPENVHCLVPIPANGHPNKLINHFAAALLRLPVAEVDPVKRLTSIQDNLDKLLITQVPSFAFTLGYAIGALFPCLVRCITNEIRATLMTTSFPGPKNIFHLLGHKCVDTHVNVGSCFSAPIVFTSLTYGDSLRIHFSVNTKILDNQQIVDDIQNAITREFALLKKC